MADRTVSGRLPATTETMPMEAELIDIAFVRSIVDRAQSCLRPLKEAEILPTEAYVSEKFWEFEKRAIFTREWLCIAHVNEIPNPGDYLPLTIIDEPVIVVRDEGGTVRVLSAICQHRGHPIVGGVAPLPKAGICLNARRLICPYHNWTYGLDGRLIGAPSMQETTPLRELRRHVRLPQLRSEIFHGLIFVNFNMSAPPVAPGLKKLEQEFDNYGIERLVPGHVFAQEGLKWNWKLHHENALEPYHTDYVHKDYHGAVPSNLTRFFEFDVGDGQVMRTTGFAAKDGDLFEESGSRRLPDIDGLTEEQRRRVFFVSVMPCLVAVLQPSFVTMTFLNPTAAGQLSSRRINLYSKAATATPEFDRIRLEQFEQMRIIIMQDQETQVALQQAYHSRYAPRGHLSHLETAISQLNRWVIDKYQRALSDAGMD
jgi:phenylpropionate dioxygenase-like ring-hydroxylating dioxygenase large terminal subunit